MQTRKVRGRPFQKGHDARRHIFTREECRRGFEAAWASLERRFPGCDPHFLLCAICGSRPARTFYWEWAEEGLTEEQIIARCQRP